MATAPLCLAHAQVFDLRRITTTNLSFPQPVEMVAGPTGAHRLYIISQAGIISSVADTLNNPRRDTVLDMRTRVTSGGEQGLLGMAFHPDFGTNRKVYLHYTRRVNNVLTTHISQFTFFQAPSNKIDPASELVLLTAQQPFTNHNGGTITFGPDGFLYIALGDGGSAGDPQNLAQNRASLLGKVLRIDVNTTSPGLNYGIPATNPYAGNAQGFRQEIYAYGLRNPWKCAFDNATGKLWCADVGQNAREEISIIESGKNYGWRITEGNRCYNPANNCNTAGLEAPLFDYAQNAGDKSITGGFVYRGSLFPDWVGGYVYGDYVSGRVWLLKQDQSGTWINTQIGTVPASTLSSFGQDENGELYICNLLSGVVGRMTPRVTNLPGMQNQLSGMTLAPNPAQDRVQLSIQAVKAGAATLTLVDMLGKEIGLNTTSYMLDAGANSLQVQLPKNLKAGVYNVYLELNGTTAVQRLVVSK